MKILFFCPRWGSEHLAWDDFAARVRAAGYDGVECSLHGGEQALALQQMNAHGLQWIAQHWETVDADVATHQQAYEQRLRSLAAGRPLFINTQTGKDYFTFQQNAKLIEAANEIAAENGVHIVHETHRGKFSFAAHIMQSYLQRLPSLRITFDVSHWFAVAETFLHDQQEAVQLAIERTDHLHARVGFTEGPQVSDPRAPEWADAVAHHLHLWDEVIAQKKKAGAALFTITPEYGAPPYQPLQPYTQKPLADQWDVNVYMMQLLRTRYTQIKG